MPSKEKLFTIILTCYLYDAHKQKFGGPQYFFKSIKGS